MPTTSRKKISIDWQRDGIDRGWFYSPRVGSVRSPVSYRAGGWYFLPMWLPDLKENDIGPFKTRDLAFAEAERLAAVHMPSAPSLRVG